MRTRSAALALALTFALAACGSGPTALDDGGSTTGVVQSVDVVENDSLTVEAATASDTVVAVLRDSLGNPVPGDISSWEIEGGTEEECGFWESGSLQSNSAGEVRNTLNAGEVAWTAFDAPDCTYRVVHSSEGAPEPVLDSVSVRVQPGEPRSGSLGIVVEEDGTFDEFGPDGDAVAQFTDLWRDVHGNPVRYEVSAGGPVEVVTLSGAPDWTRSLRAGGSEAVGSVTVWTLPDSTEALDGEYEVTHYQADGEQQTWICVALEPETLADCEGPPEGL